MTWSVVDARRALELLGEDAPPVFARALRHLLTYPSHSAASIVADAFATLMTDQLQVELRIDMAELAIREAETAENPPGTDKALATRLETG